MAVRDQKGGFDLIRIEESTPTHTIVLAEERDSDTVARLTNSLRTALDTRQLSRYHARQMSRQTFDREAGW